MVNEKRQKTDWQPFGDAIYQAGFRDGYEAGREDQRREILAQIQSAPSPPAEQKDPPKKPGRPFSDSMNGPAFVRTWLRQYGRGDAKQIVSAMREQPELAHHFAQNRQWGHTTLGRMRSRGQLLKDGKIYRLNPEKDQPVLRLISQG